MPSQQCGSKKQAAHKIAMSANCIGNVYLAKRHFQVPLFSSRSTVESSFGSSGSGCGAAACTIGLAAFDLPGCGDGIIVIPAAPVEFVRLRCLRLLLR